LFIRVIDAGGGGEEEPLTPDVFRGEEQVGINQHTEHTQGFVVLDEAHAAHIGGEIVNDMSTLQRRVAIPQVFEIEDEIIDLVKDLIPIRHRFHIHRSHLSVALPKEFRDEMAPDKAAAAADNDLAIHDLWLVGWIGSV
jgi:hypothetical protein